MTNRLDILYAYNLVYTINLCYKFLFALQMAHPARGRAFSITTRCPHCLLMFVVESKDLNCRVFRHGVYRSSLKQINPHLKKDECDRLRANSLIYGCGKPFKLVPSGRKEEYRAVVCGYI